MTDVTFTFSYKAPNGAGNPDPSDYTSQQWTYTGPDRFWVVVRDEDNKPNNGLWYTQSDVNAPPDNYKVEVIAEDNPILACVVVGCVEDDHVRKVSRTDNNGQTYNEHEYEPLGAAYELDCFTYDRDSGTWSFSWAPADWSTWDEVRNIRNFLLEACDHRVKADTPEAVKAPWLAYRTLLRDITTNWADCEPWQVQFPAAPPNNTENPGNIE
jgi:hypothetical protein